MSGMAWHRGVDCIGGPFSAVTVMQNIVRFHDFHAAPGGNASFTLVFEPPTGMPNGSYAENPLLTISGGGADPVPLSAGLVITSSRKGGLHFNIASADVPPDNPTGRLGGAQLQLTSLDIAGMTLNASADANGLARFMDVPAGRYMYKAEAQGYNTMTGTVQVEPGLSRSLDVFLPTTMVSYKWSVTPTTITDKYDITLDMTFRTDVPAPALVLDPPSLSLNMKGGETAYTQFTLTNKGLVSAFKLKTELEGDGVLHLDSSVTEIAELKAGQSVVLPVRIKLDHASGHSGKMCTHGIYEPPCGSTMPTTSCCNIEAGDTPDSGGGGQEGGPGGSFGHANSGLAQVPVMTLYPAVVTNCGPSAGEADAERGPGYPFLPNRCEREEDPLTGNFSEKLPDMRLTANSPAPSYTPGYNSLDGVTAGVGAALETRPDGTVLLTLPDGAKVLFVQAGALDSGLAGDMDQFNYPAGYNDVLYITGGRHMLRGKDGTVTRFESVPYAGPTCTGHNCPSYHRVTRQVDRNGGALTYDYTTADSSGKVSRITDPHGRTIDITYTPDGKPTAAADFTGRQVAYEYDAAGNLTLATDMDGAQTAYAYDAQGLMTGVTYPNGAHKSMTYDAQRRVLTIAEDNGNNAQTFDYQDTSSRTIVTDALGRQTVYDYITVDGRKEVTKITAPDGTVTKYGYDGDLNRISVTDALNRETAMEYDGKGNMVAARDPAGNTTRLSYEPTYNQPVTVTDPRGASTGMRYDLRGNLMEVSDALGNKTEMSYDALGHVTGTKDPLGNVTLFEYDNYGALGKVTDPLNRITLMTRDNLSRVTQTRDPSNKLTLFEYDIKGNLTKVTDALNGITEYGYTGGCAGCGGGDLLASVKDAKNQLTSFQYDLQKRLTGTTNPLSQSKTFAYDKKGNLTSVTDAKGQTITFEYDVNDRLTVKHLPEGDITYTYDPVGNLLSVTSPDSSISMTYGILNQVVQVQQVTGGQTYTISYGYDVNGNRTSMTSPWGTTSYTYDALNRLSSLTNPDGKLITFAYDALGRRTRMSYPNGTETTYAYDAASQLTQVLHRKVADSTALAFNNYAYDTAGNRTSMQDLTGSHGYGYDDLHRLVSASHPGLPNETFAYDAVGNRTSDAVMTNYQHNAANRLLENSAYTYTYDNNGNLTGQTHKTTSDHTSYAYTTENQLKQVTLPGSGGIVTFKYDPLGRRIEKSGPDGTTRYVYDNEDIIAVLDGNNTLKQNITHGPGIDEPLIMKSSTSANYYYHADGLGSITALSDEQGAIAETYEYQAYGKPTIKDHTGTVFDASTLGNPYLFTAREYDNETGLYYFRARYYDFRTGVLIQVDPFSLQTNDLVISQDNYNYEIIRRLPAKNAKGDISTGILRPDSSYAYTLNNPTNNTDPNGELVPQVIAIGLITIIIYGEYVHPLVIEWWYLRHPELRPKGNNVHCPPPHTPEREPMDDLLEWLRWHGNRPVRPPPRTGR